MSRAVYLANRKENMPGFTRFAHRPEFKTANFDEVDLRDYYFGEDNNIPKLLDEREELKEAGERFNELSKQIKDWVKTKSGLDLSKPDTAIRIKFPGWDVEVVVTKFTKYDIPSSIKSRYAKHGVKVDQRFLREDNSGEKEV